MESPDIIFKLGEISGKLDSTGAAVISVGNEVKSLRDDFNTMEKGRLTRLEVSFKSLETQVETRAKSSGFWYAIFASASASVISGIVLYALLK